MKSFDFFRKLSYNDIKHQTLLGGLLSICAIILISFLLITEINSFRTPLIIKNSFIKQFPSTQEIPVRFSLQTFFCPCAIISVDQEDLIGNHEMNLDETQITKIQIDSKNQVINSKLYSPHKTDKLTESLLKNETCYIGGKISIKRVPGDFHISFHNYGPQWKSVVYNKPELSKKVKMSHHIKTMDFGAMERFKLFRYGIDPRSFFRTDLPDFSEFKENRDYIYYVKLIPYRFVDENRNRVDYSYQYAVSYKDKPQENEQPLVLVKYEFSAVTMQVTIQGRDYFHFLTHVCAIVGGIFVVFSILNRFLVSFFDFGGGSGKK